MAGVGYDPNIVRLDRSQRSFKLSFEQFYARRVGSALMARGKSLMSTHAGTLSRVQSSLSVTIEASLSGRELLRLAPGDVVSLGVAARRPIDVLVGSTLKFKGRLAVTDGRVGVRIEECCGTRAPMGALSV